MTNRWLVKTEPTIYSFADLLRDKKTPWDGVSNNLALIHMRRMEPGDAVFVYHTGKEKAVVGLARVARAAYAGPAVHVTKPSKASTVSKGAADPKDPKDQKDKRDAKLVVVDFEAVAALATPVPIAAIRADAACRDMGLVRIPRLSVMPVSPAAWASIAKAGGISVDT